MGRLAVVGAEESGGITLRVYNDAGTQQWTAEHGATLYGVAIDSQGSVIVGGEPGTGGYTLRKYDYDGNLLWSYDHGATVYCVAVGANDTILLGGGDWSPDSQTARRLSSDGSTELWTANHGTHVYGIAAVSDGGVVLTGARTGSVTTRRYYSDGSLYWSYDHGNTTYGVMCNNTGVYTVGEAVSGYTTRNIYLWGTLNTSFTLGSVCRAICNGDADNPGDYYIVYAGNSDGSRTTTRHFYGSTILNWDANHGATVYGCTTDASSNVYTVGVEASGVALRKYSSAGTLDTGWNKSHGATLRGVAWGSGSPALVAVAPGLALRFALAVPAVGGVVTAPGLPLKWEVAAPTAVGALPPDGRLTPLPVLYRCYLSGTTDVELPLISLQCTRRLGQSTWLGVEVMYNAERAAAIAERAGGQLIIYAGLRNALGQELLGEFARAWLTETEATREPGAGRLILTGRIVPTPFTAQTRTLLKVTQRQRVDGRHEVRCCAVDPLLRPNDTVVDGAETWGAGTIHYRISAREAFMQVTEVGD